MGHYQLIWSNPILTTWNKQQLVLSGHFDLFRKVTAEHRFNCFTVSGFLKFFALLMQALKDNNCLQNWHKMYNYPPTVPLIGTIGNLALKIIWELMCY